MNDFEEFNVTPERTLDPFQEEKKETPQIYQETEPETPEIVLTPEAVSYTHLDVYKRQIYWIRKHLLR